MATVPPLRFSPIFQYRLWGGRRLADFVQEPLPGEGPIGEAWILSDRDDYPSRVVEGPYAGQTLKEIAAADPQAIFGKFSDRMSRYPLLLKFLDAREMLSVQVHPTDAHTDYLPAGERGKTEAWVVLRSDPESSILAGVQPGTTAEDLRHLTRASADAHLASFNPSVGDTIFLEAGTVHALGGGVVVFEVQQNSDVTFRLYDWDRVDEKTGHARELHIESAIACTDFSRGPVTASNPILEATSPVTRERLVECEFFLLWRHTGSATFEVGTEDAPRVLMLLSGTGHLRTGDESVEVKPGQVYFLPASLGTGTFEPTGEVVLFEVGLPD